MVSLTYVYSSGNNDYCALLYHKQFVHSELVNYFNLPMYMVTLQSLTYHW